MEFTRTVKYMEVEATTINPQTKQLRTETLVVDHIIKDEAKLEKEVASLLPTGLKLVSIDNVSQHSEVRSIPYSVFIQNSKVITR